MSTSSENADAVPQEPLRGGSREVVCLIKRASYMLTLDVPRHSPARLSLAHAALHARLQQGDQPCEFTLAPLELKAFYEDLSVVLDYLREGWAEPNGLLAATDATRKPAPSTDTPSPDTF